MYNLRKTVVYSLLVSIGLVALIVIFEPYISDVKLGTDTGASYYVWKLTKRNEINMAIVWSLFITHLLGNYYLIRKRMQVKARGVSKENIKLLVFNLIFIIFHLIQSIIGYDGLAQDVSIFSSQYSVIFVLVTILFMQAPKRGIFFGRKFKINPKFSKFIYATHGFVFTFSIIYTFWYHPMINTIGHLVGFFYMFLLIIQLCLIKTRIHTNGQWIVLLEALVALHGASVAYYVQNSDLWSMFLFGFGFIFVFTQVYGLGVSRKIVSLIQIIFVLVIAIYYSRTGIGNIHQVLWIPVVEYGHVVVLYAISRIFDKKQKTIS